MVWTLTNWGARSILLDAVVATEELVTSAVKTTGVRDERVHWTEITRINFITVHLLGLEDSIRIEVWDSAPKEPEWNNKSTEVSIVAGQGLGIVSKWITYFISATYSAAAT